MPVSLPSSSLLTVVLSIFLITPLACYTGLIESTERAERNRKLPNKPKVAAGFPNNRTFVLDLRPSVFYTLINTNVPLIDHHYIARESVWTSQLSHSEHRNATYCWHCMNSAAVK